MYYRVFELSKQHKDFRLRKDALAEIERIMRQKDGYTTATISHVRGEWPHGPDVKVFDNGR